MTKNKRGEKRDESSVQVALGELMGIEEERQTAEREEARRAAAEEARRREAAEAQRAAAEETRRREAEERRKAEDRAREEEAWAKQREAADREARIRAEAEAQVRTEEVRRVYELELQMKRAEVGRRRIPTWLAPSIAVLALGGVGLFATLYLSMQAGAAERLAEAERSKTDLKTELEREIDAARAERLTAIAELEIEKRRVEDAQRQLKEKCDTVALMSRPPQKPRPAGQHGSGGRPGTQGSGLEDVGSLSSHVSDDPLDDNIDLTSAKDRKKQP